ncbi:MAG: hypothetical protein IJV14_08710 [Lachnospiraceae bacterium]|nr:hypothetical protein [Lachnospiraceae bacterium]
MEEVEALLREQHFSNSDHKKKLHEHLVSLNTEMGDDEMSRIAGGIKSSEMPVFVSWIEKHDA